jgi:hypothetical protein
MQTQFLCKCGGSRRRHSVVVSELMSARRVQRHVRYCLDFSRPPSAEDWSPASETQFSASGDLCSLAQSPAYCPLFPSRNRFEVSRVYPGDAELCIVRFPPVFLQAQIPDSSHVRLPTFEHRQRIPAEPAPEQLAEMSTQMCRPASIAPFEIAKTGLPLLTTPRRNLTTLRRAARCAGSRPLFSGSPRPPGALLDVASDKTSHDLRRRGVLLDTESLEETLLARVDENRQSCCAVLERHGYPWANATVFTNPIIIEYASK